MACWNLGGGGGGVSLTGLLSKVIPYLEYLGNALFSLVILGIFYLVCLLGGNGF